MKLGGVEGRGGGPIDCLDAPPVLDGRRLLACVDRFRASPGIESGGCLSPSVTVSDSDEDSGEALVGDSGEADGLLCVL